MSIAAVGTPARNISAVIAITGAIVAVLALRHVPAGAQSAEPADVAGTHETVTFIEFDNQEACNAA